MKKNTSKIVIAAGGTAGHLFPAEALAQELKRRNYEIIWITDARGACVNTKLKDDQRYIINVEGINGKNTLSKLSGLAKFACGTYQARKLLNHIKPSAVIGFGGYASAPTVMAASNLGIPTAIHEQNAVLGRANRLLAKRVNKVCVSFRQTQAMPIGVQPIYTGMPVRSGFDQTRNQNFKAPGKTGEIRVLVLGGSQGASVFSDLIPSTIKFISEPLRYRLRIDQQCRKERLDNTLNAFSDTGVCVRLQAFFDDIPELLSQAHLVVSRSGASTVSEITYSGRPAIYVPLPHSADNHQYANAKAIAESGGGWCQEQRKLSPELLSAQITTVLRNQSILLKAAKSAKAFGSVNASQNLANIICSIENTEVQNLQSLGGAA
ncbi:MAG: undecaprenyldiphospho-muramoylpentapeptide beta-N-acetylglucosaminyltransferase [Rhodospirillaceae bacterium]|nr:undecaprenyldiphospho-muramoylpentapeptide beta-N-acetylglucosaminyltransferase [Rhodospirillaceae bacterium]